MRTCKTTWSQAPNFYGSSATPRRWDTPTCTPCCITHKRRLRSSRGQGIAVNQTRLETICVYDIDKKWCHFQPLPPTAKIEQSHWITFQILPGSSLFWLLGFLHFQRLTRNLEFLACVLHILDQLTGDLPGPISTIVLKLCTGQKRFFVFSESRSILKYVWTPDPKTSLDPTWVLPKAVCKAPRVVWHGFSRNDQRGSSK